MQWEECDEWRLRRAHALAWPIQPVPEIAKEIVAESRASIVDLFLRDIRWLRDLRGRKGSPTTPISALIDLRGLEVCSTATQLLSPTLLSPRRTLRPLSLSRRSITIIYRP